MDLILSVLAALVAMLIVCSLLDWKTGRVPKRYSFIVFLLSATFFFLSEPDFILTVGAIISFFAITWWGGYLMNEGYYGGADIHIAMALSPILVLMKVYGALFVLWMLLLVPALSRLSAKFARMQTSEIISQKKIRFVPIISFIFIGLLSAWLWSTKLWE